MFVQKPESTANKEIFHFELLKTTRSVMTDIKKTPNNKHFYMTIKVL